MFKLIGHVRQSKCLLVCCVLIVLFGAVYVFIVATNLATWNHLTIPSSTTEAFISQLQQRNVYIDVHENCTALTYTQTVEKTNLSSDIVMHKYLNIFNASDENEEERNSINANKCVPLRTSVGKTPICIYDPTIDKWVSGGIVKGGMWEGAFVNLMASVLVENPDMQLLDIGSNIGVYTLQAAKMGRKVIAVDANKFNLRLLAKSLRLGELEKYVTLVWNAITDIHETINLTITTGNIGGSFVKSAGDVSPPANNRFRKQTALSITLEDIVGFVKGNSVFMKIDIEKSEWKAFRGGEIFFNNIDVRYILMEWVSYKQGSNGAELIRFMTRFGFQPYAVRKPLQDKLNADNFATWPGDVLWVKK